MSCVDLMYQFYSPYFSYKSSADDTSIQKFPSQPLYDAAITGSSPPNNFLETTHSLTTHHHNNTTTSTTNNDSNSNNNHHHSDKDSSRDSNTSSKTSPPHHQHHPHLHPHHHHQHQQQQLLQHQQQQPQPRATHYLTSNSVLFTYFSGETGTIVDEHFSRALSQPSSFTMDKPPPANKPYSRSESLLMCHRKLPPSFWNSSYQAPPCTNSNLTTAFGADAYFQSSLYNFHKAWPYHYSHHTQPHTYPHHQGTSHGLPYTSMDTTGRLSSHYGSFMMPGAPLSSRADSRTHSQYDFSKTTDAFSNYYAMGRFGTDMESALPGLDLPLQQTKKEHYW